MEEKKEELVGLNVVVPKKVRNELKMLAALKGMKMTEIFLEMFEDFKKKQGASK